MTSSVHSTPLSPSHPSFARSTRCALTRMKSKQVIPTPATRFNMEDGAPHLHKFESRKYELQALLHNPDCRDDVPNIRAALEYYWENATPHDEQGCVMFYNGKRIHVLDSASLQHSGRLWIEKFSSRLALNRVTEKLVTLRKVEVLTVKMGSSHPCGKRRPPSDSSSEPIVTPDSGATAISSGDSTPAIPTLLSVPEGGEELQRRDMNTSASSGFAPETGNYPRPGAAFFARPEQTTPATRRALPPQNNAIGNALERGSSPRDIAYMDRLEKAWIPRKKLTCHDGMSADTNTPSYIASKDADKSSNKTGDSLPKQKTTGQPPSEEPKPTSTEPVRPYVCTCCDCREIPAESGPGGILDELERSRAEAAASFTWPDLYAEGKASDPSGTRGEYPSLTQLAQRGSSPVRIFHRLSPTRGWVLDDGSNPAVARADGAAPALAFVPTPVPGRVGPPSHRQSKPSVPLEIDASPAGSIMGALDRLEGRLVLLEARLDDMD